MTQNIRKCLVVGSGNIALRHISNLRLLLPWAKIGCASASGRTIAEADIPGAMPLASLKDALAWMPDIAIVASPAPLHLQHAAALLETGIAVLIEKPLCDSGATYESFATRVLPWRHRIKIAYNLRYLSSYRMMHKLVADKVIGRTLSIHIDVGQYLPEWRPKTDYRNSVSSRRSLGGGVLLELSHEFDYLNQLFGSFDRAFCVTGHSGELDIDVEDSADILLIRTNGAIAQLHLDFLQRRATRCCKVIGTYGNLKWDLIANSITLETASQREVLFAEPIVDRNAMYIDLLREFIEMSQGHITSRISYEDGIAVVSMVEAIRRSSESGLPVNIVPLPT